MKNESETWKNFRMDDKPSTKSESENWKSETWNNFRMDDKPIIKSESGNWKIETWNNFRRDDEGNPAHDNKEAGREVNLQNLNSLTWST